MSISPLEEYALRCALRLARLKEGEHLSASAIAEGEAISVEYVSKIMFLLRKHGLVSAVRGIKGGFKLDRLPEEVPLKEVFGALSKNRKTGKSFCEQFKGQSDSCVHLGCCSMRPFWSAVSVFFDGLTSRLTLQDLLEPEPTVKRKVTSLTGQFGVATGMRQ